MKTKTHFIKTKFITLFFLLNIGILFSYERIIPPTSLPPNITSFVQSTFKQPVAFAQIDDGDYELGLADGTHLKFSSGGKWKDIKSMGGVNPAILPSLLPPPIIAHIQSTYPGIPVYEMEQDFWGYEIKLMNRMKLKFGGSGQLRKVEFDD